MNCRVSSFLTTLANKRFVHPVNPTNAPSSQHWIHPVHARGVPSRTYSNIVGGPLTDAAIFKYALQGYYGEEAKRNAEESKKLKGERKRAKKQQEKLVRDILKDIDDEN